MTLFASDIMTPHVKSVPCDWSMLKLAAFLSEHEISGSPVVSEAGDIIGIVTLADISDFKLTAAKASNPDLSEAETELTEQIKRFIMDEMERTPVEVQDIMTPMLISVQADTPLDEVATTMMNEHVHRIFVKQQDQVVGIITAYDMLRVIADIHP